MKNANEMIGRLRARLSRDRLTDAEFTEALAEILSASTDKLSGADALLLSHEIRELSSEWRISLQRPVN
jgi:5-carboxymethyl-2-hydroxymuconate isomerase